jgi:hypothetical protein
MAANSKNRRFTAIALVAVSICLGSTMAEAMQSNPTSGFTGADTIEFIEHVASGDVAGALTLAKRLPGGINTLGKNGESALLVAVEKSDYTMTRALLDAGADPNGGPSHAPLAVAAQDDDLRIAEALLQAGANPDGTLGDETGLARAALTGRRQAVQLLLRSGANIHFPNSAGETPLLFAAAADHWATVLDLLHAGASPYDMQSNGITLAHYVAFAQSFETQEDIESFEPVKQILANAGLPANPPPPARVKEMREAGNWPPKH